MKFRSMPKPARILVIIILFIILPNLYIIKNDTIFGLDITPLEWWISFFSVPIAAQVYYETDPELSIKHSFFRYSRKDRFTLFFAYIITIILIIWESYHEVSSIFVKFLIFIPIIILIWEIVILIFGSEALKKERIVLLKK
jgi:hypothetical protein